MVDLDLDRVTPLGNQFDFDLRAGSTGRSYRSAKPSVATGSAIEYSEQGQEIAARCYFPSAYSHAAKNATALRLRSWD